MSHSYPVVIDSKDFQSKCALHAKNLTLITFAEASAITREYGHGYSVGTLYNERSVGILQVKKFGKHVYVDWSMLLDFLQRKAAQ